MVQFTDKMEQILFRCEKAVTTENFQHENDLRICFSGKCVIAFLHVQDR